MKHEDVEKFRTTLNTNVRWSWSGENIGTRTLEQFWKEVVWNDTSKPTWNSIKTNIEEK